ncbi:PAP1-domain-containing protein [Hypoxylon cercidicola]|nr:PAP1-domain-containing protein [Hypoxylon cercidicola]
MASAHSQALHNFILTPQQQNLLFRALTSNQQGHNSNNSTSSLSLSPDTLSKSPVQEQNATNGISNGIQESPYLDYDYDLGPDSGFDFDFTNDGQAKMIGDLPGGSPSKDDSSKASSPENDSPDKRSHPDDEDEDDLEDGGGKRREGEGKVPKKPGRKPLTNEPSSKRKAQNRAAQRAFRERKEKHLKDLETKVEELEKASSATTNENSQLRAQIDKLTMELNEYKKKLTLMGNSSSPRSVSDGAARQNQSFGSAAIQNLNDVNFQFEFPKFGVLPGPQDTSMNGMKSSNFYSPSSSSNSPNSLNSLTNPSDKIKDQSSPNSSTSSKSRDNSDAQSKNGSNKSSTSPYDGAFGGSTSRTSLDSSHYSSTNTGSPCSSTGNTNMGSSSSCGTSPEPLTQSPLSFKPVDTLTTIGEEQPALTADNISHFGNLSSMDFSGIDWMTQNNGQFDPQLFGDYREPQDNILSSTTFDDSFFNDAFDVDFTTPYNMAPSPNPPKKNLIAEIDAQKESDDTILTTQNGKLLTCNNIWEKLQACPKVQSGDLDLDGLCSDLQKKAKCGGSGAVVDEQDFKAVMTKYLGQNGNCTLTASSC